jgi:hypothetical protein
MPTVDTAAGTTAGTGDTPAEAIGAAEGVDNGAESDTPAKVSLSCT